MVARQSEAMSLWPIPLYVLAGGMATRLGALSKTLPKYLMPVSAKEAFADLHLRWAASQGFKEVVLCVGHLSDQIEEYCGDGSSWQLRISYSQDGDKLLGTGGALLQAYERFHKRGPIAVTYGDTLLDISCAAVAETSQKYRGESVMSIYRNEVSGHVCNARLDGDKFLYDKKNPPKGAEHIDYGYLQLSEDFLHSLSPGVAVDLAEPLTVSSRAGKLHPFLVKNRFWEIGSPESLEDFRAKSPFLTNKDS
jgi:NDP-sugar pyrophosphorylase family protein